MTIFPTNKEQMSNKVRVEHQPGFDTMCTGTVVCNTHTTFHVVDVAWMERFEWFCP